MKTPEIIKVDVIDYTITEDKVGNILTDGTMYHYFGYYCGPYGINKEIAELMTKPAERIEVAVESRQSDLSADDLVKLKEKFTVDDIIRMKNESIL
ncbi:MAG: hypothetical protein KAJ18_12155 [Candidatus Omnitrophica bacterium]|nr:hypothetical protein [Candidatus Omnitrophota bacterium]